MQRRDVTRRSGPPPGLAARRAAAAILNEVVEARASLDALLDDTAPGRGAHRAHLALDVRDRALARAILGVALRRRGTLARAIEGRLARPLARDAGLLSAILHVGAAQILFLDVPDHAAVSLAVSSAASDPRTRAAQGLVNGVLRRIARERDSILAEPLLPGADTPPWLWERWARHYGEDEAEGIAEVHRVQPPLDLSVAGDGEALAQRLGGRLLPTGSVRLEAGGRVADLPGFDEGLWWVQDAAAALPARLLGNVAGLDVADLCAAPGGKTAQLTSSGARVTAVDVSTSRLERLRQNLSRLRLTANTVAADILNWQPQSPFDAILLDAPCTATGTIRRHPDIAWTKRPEDIGSLAELQARMLDRALDWLKPGGRLVFCTCSLEPEEGERQADSLLARRPDIRLDPVRPEEVAGLAQLIDSRGRLRTLPSSRLGDSRASGMDSFFAARFVRPPDA